MTDEVPETIYHYTTTAGLLGILGDGVLRATHLRHMNDFGEARAGLDALDKLGNPEVDTILLKLKEVMDMHTMYAACFTTVDDDVQMWRGYGIDGGFAIGFDVERLTQSVLAEDSRPWELRKVNYSRDDFESRVAHIAKGANMSGGDYWDKVFEIASEVASYKSSEWTSEEEFRLLGWQRSDRTGEIKFRDGSLGLTPYVEMKLFNPDTVTNGLITSVIVGPGVHQAERLDAAEIFGRFKPTVDGHEWFVPIASPVSLR